MIIDEYSIAERVLATKIIKDKSELFIVSKYLRQEMDCDVAETTVMLDNILTKSDKNYNPIKAASYLEKMAKKAKDYKLKKLDIVILTEPELQEIQKLNNSKLERLAFTLLIYAKVNNALSEDNDNWCNIKLNDLYKIARVSTRNAKEKALLLNKLNKLGYITFSKKNTNLNLRYSFIDDSAKVFKEISDIRELGYQYIAFKDEKYFTYCKKCGVIIKKKSKNDYSTKYCTSCNQSSRNEILLKSFHKLD